MNEIEMNKALFIAVGYTILLISFLGVLSLYEHIIKQDNLLDECGELCYNESDSHNVTYGLETQKLFIKNKFISKNVCVCYYANLEWNDVKVIIMEE